MRHDVHAGHSLISSLPGPLLESKVELGERRGDDSLAGLANRITWFCPTLAEDDPCQARSIPYVFQIYIHQPRGHCVRS